MIAEARIVIVFVWMSVMILRVLVYVMAKSGSNTCFRDDPLMYVYCVATDRAGQGHEGGLSFLAGYALLHWLARQSPISTLVWTLEAV